MDKGQVYAGGNITDFMAILRDEKWNCEEVRQYIYIYWNVVASH